MADAYLAGLCREFEAAIDAWYSIPTCTHGNPTLHAFLGLTLTEFAQIVESTDLGPTIYIVWTPEKRQTAPYKAYVNRYY